MQSDTSDCNFKSCVKRYESFVCICFQFQAQRETIMHEWSKWTFTLYLTDEKRQLKNRKFEKKGQQTVEVKDLRL